MMGAAGQGFPISLLVLAALAAAMTIVPQRAWAQTPAQMEYDRQQREYWRQQEQQQMNENARRQQEEMRQLNAPARQSGNAGQGATQRMPSSGQPGGQALEEARQMWLKRPPLPPERNPLLGRWTRPPSGKENSSDPFAALQALAKGGLCELFFGGGTFEFRATTLVGSDARTSEQELDKVEYRGDAKQVVVLPQTTVRLMVFDVEGPNRINWSGQNCALVRVGAASRSASVTSTAPPKDAATASSSASSSKGAASPASSAPTSIARASDGSAGNAASRGTLLSLVAGLQYPSGKYFPLAGTTFYVLKENLDAVLARGGVQAPSGLSPLRAWILACEAQQTATCSQGNRAFETNTVATLRSDLQGRAELGTLSAGTYYVYGGNQRYQQRNVLWNVRVDVRDGANNAVKLDQANLTSIN